MDRMMFLRNRLQRIARFAFGALIGLRVRGEEFPWKTGNLMLVCNHISDLDPPVLGSTIPRQSFFMAKHQLFSCRMSEFYMPKIGAFPVNRDTVDTQALRTGLEVLQKGFVLVVFPEGTRSTDGQLLPVKPGVGLLAVKSQVPVLPAFIWGTDHPFRAFLRMSPCTVTYGKPILPGEISDIRRTGGTRLVAEQIMESIRRIGLDSGYISVTDS